MFSVFFPGFLRLRSGTINALQENLTMMQSQRRNLSYSLVQYKVERARVNEQANPRTKMLLNAEIVRQTNRLRAVDERIDDLQREIKLLCP